MYKLGQLKRGTIKDGIPNPISALEEAIILALTSKQDVFVDFVYRGFTITLIYIRVSDKNMPSEIELALEINSDILFQTAKTKDVHVLAHDVIAFVLEFLYATEKAVVYGQHKSTNNPTIFFAVNISPGWFYHVRAIIEKELLENAQTWYIGMGSHKLR